MNQKSIRVAAALREAFYRLPLGTLSCLAFVAIFGACMASHHEALLRYLLPAFLSLCAWGLFFHNRSHYIGFVLAVWFFTPFLRRIVDFNAGYVDPNPILLSPYAVTLVAPLATARRLLKAPLALAAPFLLCMLAVVAGAVSGYFHYHATSVVHDLLNWSTPVLFGAFLYIVDGEAVTFRDTLARWLPPLLGLTAAYTIAQFAFAFPWDIAWLVNLDAPSMGSTEPFELRAFGPLNSAGTAAFVFTVGGVYLLQRRGALRILYFALLAVALVTTQVRAGWLALAIGVVLCLWKAPRRAGAPLLVLLLLGIGASAIGFGSNAAAISDRIETFSHPSEDTSASGRLEGYDAAASYLESDPLGAGLGVPEDIFDIQGSFSLLDSSPADVFTTFGIFGIAYYLGLLGIFAAALGGVLRARDPDIALLTLPVIALLSISLLGSVTVALAGFLIFSLLGSAAHLARKAEAETETVPEAVQAGTLPALGAAR